MLFRSQIGMLILGVGIIFTYVQPTFAKIGMMQTTIVQYQEEQEKVNGVNSQLASLVSQVNSISTSDMRALTTYMPDIVDHVAVSRDIFLMAEMAGVYLQDVTYDGMLPGAISETGELEEQSELHAFSVNVSGTYEQIKGYLQIIEQNNYPLDVKKLSMTSTETGIITTDLLLITYSYAKNI